MKLESTRQSIKKYQISLDSVQWELNFLYAFFTCLMMAFHKRRNMYVK